MKTAAKNLGKLARNVYSLKGVARLAGKHIAIKALTLCASIANSMQSQTDSVHRAPQGAPGKESIPTDGARGLSDIP